MAHAAGDSHDIPIYGAHCLLTFPILDADGDLVTAAAGLDSEVSKDLGTMADCTNEATEIATSSGVYYLYLTGAEMTANIVSVIVKTSTSGAKTTVLTLYPKRLPIFESGTAQAGASTTITLASGASSVDNFYNGMFVYISNNGAAGSQYQARKITSYTGSTRVATVESAWGTNPSASSTYDILMPETVRPAGNATFSLVNNAGTTTLTGAVSLASTLGVTGATTFTGNVGMAAGLNITQSSSNTSALVITGNGTGHGVIATSGSGATGDGVKMVSAATNGNGLNLVSTGTGAGLNTDEITNSGITTLTGAVSLGSTLGVTGTTTLAALTTTGTTTVNAFTCTNAFTVSGATVHTGNVSMAAGLNITQSSGNTSALVVTGNGTGHGAIFTSGSGATGDGLKAVSAATNGNGVNGTGAGTGSGGLLTSGASGGAGLKAAGGGTGSYGLHLLSGGGFGGGLLVDGSGSNAAVITTTAGTGLAILTSDGNGVTISGGSTIATGCGMIITGGAGLGGSQAGHGLKLIGGASTTAGGATAGNGLYVIGGAGSATTNGAAIGAWFTGGGTNTVASTAAGIYATGTSNGSGVQVVSAGSGSGLLADTISTSGAATFATFNVTGATVHTGNVSMAAGLNITQSSSNTSALVVTGNGTGHGAIVTSGSGATGDGVKMVSAATNGNGLNLVSTGTGAGLNTDEITNSGATTLTGTVSATDASNDIRGVSLTTTGVTAVAAGVWNSTRSTYVTAGTFGQSLQLPRSGTAQSGVSNTIILDSGASSVDDFYQNCAVQIIGGTGAGQVNLIESYAGVSKIASLRAAWPTELDATSVFAILPTGVDLGFLDVSVASRQVSAGGSVDEVTGDDIELIIGVDYKNANSNAVSFAPVPSAWTDLTGATVTLTLQTNNGAAVNITGTVDVASGTSQSIRFDVPVATTSTAVASIGRYFVWATLASGDVYPLSSGNIQWKNRLEA